MFSSVTKWLGGTGPEDATAQDPEAENEQSKVDESEPQEPKPNDDSDQSDKKEVTESTNDQENQPDSLDDLQNQVDEMSAKAIQSAKEWGTYLYSFGKAATVKAVDTAKQLKTTVEDKTIIGDFSREQEKFVAENKERKQGDASVPPWVGYNEEEAMKTQILALSQDKRNFQRNPPAGVQFQFDFNNVSPVASAMLDEDPNLKKMRFELVPKIVTEEVFWRNYFYRVSLIKQSAQLSSLAQQTGSTGEGNGVKTEKAEAPQKEKSAEVAIPSSETKQPAEEEELPASPPDHEFVSDTFQAEGLSEEELKQEMQQLGMTEDNKEKKGENSPDDDIPEWEKELQAELQEYEVVDDGKDDLEDADLEQEILKQIEAEATSSS